jgi:hypothetical protein
VAVLDRTTPSGRYVLACRVADAGKLCPVEYRASSFPCWFNAMCIAEAQTERRVGSAWLVLPVSDYSVAVAEPQS